MTDTRLTLRQAAAVLNVSESAIRKRVERGTLRTDKGADGKRYVYLDTVADNLTDEGADASATPEHDALISELRAHNGTLREQLEAERQAHAEARRLLMAALERIPPQLEAPSEARESPETVDEEPERAEPQAAAGEAEEGTERLQQRSGLRAPVDKLPWWHYVLGLLLVSTATFVSFFAWQTMSTFGLNVIGNIVANVVLVWFAPAVFGFWVGLRRVNPRFESQVIPFGLLVGLAVSIGRVGQLIAVGTDYFRGGSDINYWAGFLIGPALSGWLFYVSGVLVGNAWQRRRTRRLSATISSSPEPTTGWTPRRQAILGFTGAVIAALISLMGTIGSAIMASGG